MFYKNIIVLFFLCHFEIVAATQTRTLRAGEEVPLSEYVFGEPEGTALSRRRGGASRRDYQGLPQELRESIEAEVYPEKVVAFNPPSSDEIKKLQPFERAKYYIGILSQLFKSIKSRAEDAPEKRLLHKLYLENQALSQELKKRSPRAAAAKDRENQALRQETKQLIQEVTRLRTELKKADNYINQASGDHHYKHTKDDIEKLKRYAKRAQKEISSLRYQNQDLTQQLQGATYSQPWQRQQPQYVSQYYDN